MSSFNRPAYWRRSLLYFIQRETTRLSFLPRTQRLIIKSRCTYERYIRNRTYLPFAILSKKNPLGTVTTAIASSSYPFLQTSHIPWVIDVTDDSSESELGVLRGHMARQNPQAKAMIESAKSSVPDGAQGGVQLENEVLVLFTAHAHHYVTPKFYTETKPATGKVVPTWNYSAVQAYGKATIFFDNEVASTEYLSRQIRDLSQHAEISVMGYNGVEKQRPWEVSDAPDRYIALLQKNIIGIQVEVTSLGGKFKMSQEMPEKDREGVIVGFENLNSEVGKEMARTVLERQTMRNKT